MLFSLIALGVGGNCQSKDGQQLIVCIGNSTKSVMDMTKWMSV